MIKKKIKDNKYKELKQNGMKTKTKEETPEKVAVMKINALVVKVDLD